MSRGAEQNLWTQIREWAAGRPNLLVIKLHGSPLQRAGLPDLMVMGDGRVYFIELKAKGGEPTKLQKATFAQFTRLGHPVALVDSLDGFAYLMQALKLADDADTLKRARRFRDAIKSVPLDQRAARDLLMVRGMDGLRVDPGAP